MQSSYKCPGLLCPSYGYLTYIGPDKAADDLKWSHDSSIILTSGGVNRVEGLVRSLIA